MLVPTYLGHKRITFESGAAYRHEFPRFTFAAIFGLALSWAVPWWAVNKLGAEIGRASCRERV